jgi:hypothetical protein
MGEVTQLELDRLRRQVEETRVLVELLVRGKLNKEEWPSDRLQAWLDDELEHREYMRAFGKDGVFGKVSAWTVTEALFGAGFRTLHDLASVPRSQVAGIRGVGRVSIAKLDAALAERNLSWSEAA